MKKIHPDYPRRSEMLATPFTPLLDDEFRKLVGSGAAVPGSQGSALFVSKWRDGPGMDPEVFLSAVRAQGSHLVARRFRDDVNIRVVRPAVPSARPRPASAPVR